jgi:hypothetical protein
MKVYKSKKGARRFKDGKEIKEPKMMLKRKRDGKSVSTARREFMMEHAGAKTKEVLRDIAKNPKNYKPYKSKKK